MAGKSFGQTWTAGPPIGAVISTRECNSSVMGRAVLDSALAAGVLCG